MKFIRDLGAKLNSAQKTIVAVVFPLVLFVITYIIAGEVDGFYKKSFDMEDTWIVWVLFLVIVGYFEFQLYSDKK